MTHRRRFLQTLGTLSALGVTAESPAQSNTSAMPPDIPRELAQTSADLGTLFAEAQALSGPERYDMAFVGDRFKDLDAFKRAGREKVFEVLLHRPPAVAPRAEVLQRDDLGTYIREKVVFNTTPELRVPAYVLVPKGLKGRAPALVDLHSHGGMFLFGKEKVLDMGRNHPAMTEYHRRNYEGRPTATEWVRHGYVVISIDAFMFGERRVLIDADRKFGWDRTRYTLEDVARLNQVCRGKESTIVKSLIFAGLTWPGVVFWDDIRTVDYLVTRPEVDPERIGCVGISMGGYRSIYLAGLDERIKAACITGFMSTVRPMMRAHVDTHSFVHFVPTLHRHLDLPDVASLHAPKPLLVQQCSQDRLFTLEGMKDSLARIEAAYAKAGARAQFTGRMYDAPHQFTRQMQDEAKAWFDRNL
jgi:dienelactone hydrolase